MRAEESTFLALLREFAGGGKAEIPDELDWGGLYEIAQSQSLVGLCYVLLRDRGIPADDLDRFHQGFLGEVYQAVNRAACMRAFSERTAEQGSATLEKVHMQ